MRTSVDLLVPRLDDAVGQAVSYLASAQLDYGEFPTYRYTTPQCEGPAEFESASFITCLVVYSLAWVENQPSGAHLIRRGLGFLLEEMHPPGLWPYVSSRSGLTIAPDLDDTCFASFLFAKLLPRYPALNNREIILGNRRASGVFSTFLRDPAEINDTDAVVNANTLLYLGESDRTRAAIEHLLHIIRNARESEEIEYYLEPVAVHQAVSRAVWHGVDSLRESASTILPRTEALLINPEHTGELHSALALLTWLNYDAPLDAGFLHAIEYLLTCQHADGSWKQHAYYSQPRSWPPRRYWWATPCLTTALCMEALARTAGMLRGVPANWPAVQLEISS